MRPTASLLVRILSKARVPKAVRVNPAAQPVLPRSKQPTLIDELLARQKASPDTFPPNLRVEQLPTKAQWDKVQGSIKKRLKHVLEERTSR